MPESRLSRPKRQLSRFMCEEMVYDYAEHRLDSERRQAFEQNLNDNLELQRELKAIQAAEAYCKQMALARISSLQLERLKSAESFFSKWMDRLRYRNWPDVIQWTTQALILSALVAIFALIIPWQKVRRNASRFIELNHSRAVLNSPVIANLPVTANRVAKPQVTNVSTTPKTSAATSMPAPAMQNAKSSAQAVATTPKLKGVLYRMWMQLPDVDTVAPQVRAKIIELGGYKAGQVELGWRKVNPSGAYFHFIMPKKNYDDLIKTLGGYGPVRILKTAHQRVMPPGKIRIILWMKEQPPDSQTNDRDDTNK